MCIVRRVANEETISDRQQRAVQRFRKLAAQDDQPIQLVIPLQEVLDLIQRGLMNLAMAAFTKLAECVMGDEVTA